MTSLAVPSSSPGAETPSGNRTLSILLVSVVGLFLEMMLIRWVSTEVRVFAYLQNTVLVVCFLGLGVGCFTCRQPASVRHLLVPLVVLVALLAIPSTRALVGEIGNWLSILDDLPVWYFVEPDNLLEGGVKVGFALVLSFVLMVLLWETFLPLGRILGRLLDDHPRPILSYSVNVGGSLLGIWLFAAVSAFSLPPWAWGLVAGLFLLPFLGRGRNRFVDLGLVTTFVLCCWLAGRERGTTQIVWSPYQKLALLHAQDRHPDLAGEWLINVNNAGYQGMIDLSPRGLANNPGIPKEQHGLSQYDLPPLFRPGAKNVLIVGAGSGNDAAGALRGGARSVTAVEIDPAIVTMGRQFHPEKPYDDPRVEVVVDDARSFFATTNKKYDLVIFGLLDSHTTTAMTNARLDHYVYTVESLERARSVLAEGGVLVLSFEALKPYIADRMARALHDVFGRMPLAFRVPQSRAGWGGLMLVTGDESRVRAALKGNARLRAQVARWQEEAPVELAQTTTITTDDWPYIYLEKARIPTLYYLLAVLLGGLLFYARFRLRVPSLGLGGWAPHWHFFFLGAAFMLLEVQNISKASVVLGNTWQVNAVIVSGVLFMILLSNLVVSIWPRIPLSLAGACLVGSCVALYFFDLSRLAFLPYLSKAVLVGALTTLPMFFSGLIFMDSFARTGRKDLALGANLLGALAGGLLQSVTFITGIKALLLLVAFLYVLALTTRARAARAALAPPAE